MNALEQLHSIMKYSEHNMFKINRASGMALFKAYQKKGKITCIKGKDHNPTSFFTTNLSFVGDGNSICCEI